MRISADDLAANPRLRAAVANAVARDLDGRPQARSTQAAGTKGRPVTPQAGPGLQWRCHTCDAISDTYAAAERHADAHGIGARIALTGIYPEKNSE